MTLPFSNLVRLAQQRAHDRPHGLSHIFLVGDDLRESRLTYSELDFQARAIAGFLQERKAQGERALLLYPPGLEFITAFFGCLYGGVIAVPAYPPRLNRNALRIVSIAQDSQASIVLTTGAVFSRLGGLRDHAPELGKLNWFATDQLQPGLGNSRQDWSPDDRQPAYLQYTSGSTATPKGVMITHANVLDNSAYLAKAFDHSSEDVSLSWLPHFHDLGLVHGILQPLYSGFPGYLMAPMSFLQRPLDWLRAVSRFRVTHSDGPNFAYELCVDKVTADDKKSLDLSSWKMALNGAEPVFPETIARFAEAFAEYGFKRTAFYPAYGLAEATLVVSGGKKGRELKCCFVAASELEWNRVVFRGEGTPGARTLVASGCFSPPMQVEIVDPGSGQKCAPDTIGEIWVAGPSVALGYWKRPEETKQVFAANLAHESEHAFLRTGDLGFIHQGHLFITGRLKELIIIRGRNYYPQDIERTARESSPDILSGTAAAFSVLVGTEERLVLVQELKRRQKADLRETLRRVRGAVLEEHELDVHEIVLVQAGSIPKTSSGKIQRSLCRQQFLEGVLQVIGRRQAEAAGQEERQDTGTTPLSRAEDILAWLRSRVASRLGFDAAEIDNDRPLLHLGMDSLNAVALAHDIQSRLGIVWPAANLLEDVTLADLAGRAARESESREPRKEPPVAAAGTRTEYSLSFGQQGLWFLHQLSPESPAYNVVQAFSITSRIDVPALQRSLQALVDRHGCLRTTFPIRDGKPVQRLHEKVEVWFRRENAEHWDDVRLRDQIGAEARAPFNLEQGPLWRIHLFSRSPREHVLLLAAHHIIVDLWSLAQILTEFGALYEAEYAGQAVNLEPTTPYALFVDWQKDRLNGAEGLRLRSYWSAQLSGELPVLELPLDRMRPDVQTYGGSSCPFRLTTELTAALRRVSRDCGVTLFMTLLAAFQVLLHRYSGEEDIVVGSPTAGRTRAEFASTVGYFVNPVVLRATVLPDSAFRDFLVQRVRKTVLEALEHQDYPFSLLTERLQPLRDPRRSPLFQVMFALQKAPQLNDQGLSPFALGESAARINLGGLTIESFALEQRIAQFDLSLIVAEAEDGLAATFEYNTDLFAPATIRRMAQHFETLLQGIAADPSRDVSSLSLLTEAEIKQQLIPAAPAKSFRSFIDAPVHTLFEGQAAYLPDPVAMIFEDRQFTYRELNQRADQLARCLADSGVLPGTRVAICLERSPEMIVSLLAVFKAGAVYVPIDPEYPEQRRDFMLADARVEMLITRSHLSDSPRTGLKMLDLDVEEAAISSHSNLPLPNCRDAQDLSYIIYTSGSTGNPKGVLVGHRALSNHMQWLAGEFPLLPDDRVLHKYSSSFDASLAEIFYPLITGAALVIARPGGQFDPAYLLELMRESRVTAIDVVPTMLKVLIEEPGITRCNDLRRISSGGEALSVELKERVYERLPKVELINMYGPTEAAITAGFHRCGRGQNEAQMAIGVPIANATLHVLDRGLRPAAPGAVGEICIGGEGLAWGYLNHPELTSERFVPDPFSGTPGARLYRTGDLGRCHQDGSIACIGRMDNQIKIRGFRIELGEIEAELRKHPHVQNAVALVRPRAGGDKYIAAYVEPLAGQSLSSSQLRKHLEEKLPEYMLPASFATIESFPLLASGKVDVRALAKAESDLPPPQAARPRNRIEQELVHIWQELLDRRNVGIHSNFFELGGDSILSIQVVARARQAGIALSPKQIIQFQTIAGLAQVAGTVRAGSALDTPTQGPVPLTPIQRWFFRQDLQAPEQYTQALILTARETLDVRVLEEAIQCLTTRHDALRLRFERTPQGWRQVCAAGPEASIVFRHLSLRHLPGEQQQAEVEAVCSGIRATLNLRTGPILGAACFDFGADRPQKLFITVHHLAVDAVSWRILLDDLVRVYRQVKHGGALAAPRTTFSFKRWSELLTERAQSEEMRRESEWWANKLSVPVKDLPVDHEGENSAQASRTLLVSLAREETRRLVQDVPRAWRSEINDALLAALARTLARWGKTERVLIDLEGHGREEIVEGADASDTVGWFTTLYPVLLEPGESSQHAQVLRTIKEQLRAIPGKGIGYGLLRYLCNDAALAERLEKTPGAQVSFNYLGQLQRMFSEESLFELADSLVGPMKSSMGKRSHLLEIDAYIKDGSLQAEWTYSPELHDPETIRQLAGAFINELRGLVRDCTTQRRIEYSPSDFPLAHMNALQLAAILDLHGPAVEDIYPLSPMQQGMLFHSLYEPRREIYLTQMVCELSGGLNRQAFLAAWQEVVGNFSALRSGFEWEIVTDEPVQIVRQAELEWRQHDWSGFAAQQQERWLETCLTDDRKQEMDLRHPPLMRFALIKTGEAKHLFLWTCHHLLMDGWSLPIVLRHLFAAYEALRRNQALHVEAEAPYRDYIAWLKRQNPRDAEVFWRRLLEGFDVPTSLDFLRRADSEAGKSEDFRECEVRLTAPHTAGLHEFARQHHLTPAMIAYGMWAILLSLMTGKNEVVFGVVVSGRRMGLAGADDMVGVLINTLPLPARIEPGDDLAEWLKRLQAQQSAMADFEHISLPSIQSWSGIRRGLPLFDSIVVFENYPAASWNSLSSDLRFTRVRSYERSNYPVTLWIMPEQQWGLRIGYDANLLDESRTIRLLDDYRRLLAAVGLRSPQKIGELLENRPASRDAMDQPIAADRSNSASAKPPANLVTPDLIVSSPKTSTVRLKGVGTMRAPEPGLACPTRRTEGQD